MFNLTINSTNVANSLNNMYQYKFKNGAFEVPANAEMMITSFIIPYSWYNITSRYNNNSFKIYWPISTVNSLTLTNGGSGYTDVPTVVFTGTNTTIATATAVLAPTSVASITRTAPGSGYTSAPTVAFSGGGGTGATGTAFLTPTTVASITVSPKGSGYTSVPGVVFSDGGAIGTAVLTATTIASFTVTAGGSGYTSAPTVVFTGGGFTTVGAGTAVLANIVSSIAVTAGGTGYTSAPTVVFTGGGGTGAVATAFLGTGVDAGKVVSINVTTQGTGYTSVPSISFTGGGGGSGATATAAILNYVASITLTAAGAGYTSVPAISFTGGGGTGAAATANITPTTVASITIGTAGSYTSTPPTISFTGGGGTGAVATATLTATTVASISVSNAGTGYTSVPTISFSGGGGTGATATANIAPTSIASLTLTGAGTGYQASPTISFTGGGTGTGATATASTYIPNTLTLDDGFYTVNALNARIQQFCIEKKMYLTDGSGNNIYYLSITPNSTAYANQIITKLVPTSKPTGYVEPSGFIGYPAAARPPYVEILSTNNFGKYLGFSAGNYGINQIADYNVLSNLIPQGSTVNSLVVKCSLVNNGCSNQSDILDAFAIGGSSGGTFGGNLNYTNTIEKFVGITEGRYNNFIVNIVDQNNNDIAILDSNLLINFLIRVKK